MSFWWPILATDPIGVSENQKYPFWTSFTLKFISAPLKAIFAFRLLNKHVPLVTKFGNGPLRSHRNSKISILTKFGPFKSIPALSTPIFVFRLVNKHVPLVVENQNRPCGPCSYGQGQIQPSFVKKFQKSRQLFPKQPEPRLPPVHIPSV